MNALTTCEPRNQAVTSRRDAGRALAAIDAKHLKPIPAPPWGDRLGDLLKRSNPDTCRRGDASAVLAEIPPGQALETYRTGVARLLQGPPDRNDTRAMIGLMLAAFPATRAPDPDAYADSLLHYALDARHPPTVVALACRNVVLGRHFAPSVAEFLSACTEAADKLRTHVRMAEVLAEHRAALEQRVGG